MVGCFISSEINFFQKLATTQSSDKIDNSQVIICMHTLPLYLSLQRWNIWNKLSYITFFITLDLSEIGQITFVLIYFFYWSRTEKSPKQIYTALQSKRAVAAWLSQSWNIFV